MFQNSTSSFLHERVFLLCIATLKDTQVEFPFKTLQFCRKGESLLFMRIFFDGW